MRFFFLALSIVVTVPSMAFSCNLKNPNFGSAINQASSLYKVNSEIVDVYSDSSTKGEVIISASGRVVCQYLPEKSTAYFMYIDNKLVNIKIKNSQESDSLLKYIKEIFGKSDDEDRKKIGNGKTAISMWGGSPQYSVIYLAEGIDGGVKSETLNITSKKHSDLFAKIAQEKENEINSDDGINNRYLNRNNSNGYSGVSNSQPPAKLNASGDNKNPEYDPKALEKLKKEYERQNESWKKSNN